MAKRLAVHVAIFGLSFMMPSNRPEDANDRRRRVIVGMIGAAGVCWAGDMNELAIIAAIIVAFVLLGRVPKSVKHALSKWFRYYPGCTG
jgi:hypothetical protein